MRKTCRVCGEGLSPAAFNDSARSPDGLASICRACVNARRRERGRVHKANRSPVSESAKLAKALRNGDLQSIRSFLKAGQSPPWDWVCQSMRRGHLELAQLLLERGAERNIFTLASLADLAGLRRMLRRRPKIATSTTAMQPGSTEITPLHVACSSNWTAWGERRLAVQVQAAQILVDGGASVVAAARYSGMEGATPLFCACWSSENVRLVEWLLARGAEPSDRDLLAALGHFQRHQRPAYDIAEVLLARGIPVDGSTPGDRTPLQAFAAQGAHPAVRWLLERGANPSVTGPGGRTAVHLAAERNTGPNTIALLVEHGANLAARDDDGRTPLDIAKLNQKQRLVAWIEHRLRKNR